jgi:hypothetical protein
MIEDSEAIKQWKLIPKAHREKLSRKQLIALGRETTMAEAITVEIADKPKKNKQTKMVIDD